MTEAAPWNNVTLREVPSRESHIPDDMAAPEGLDASALAEPLRDGRLLICCAGSSAMVHGEKDHRWLWMPGADLTLLNTGRAPLLLDHRHDVDNLVGVIEKAWTEGEALYAIARFATTERARHARHLVRDGVLRNVSLGLYAASAPDREYSTARRAYWWRPYEVSLVTVPKDWSARVVDGPVPPQIRQTLVKTIVEAGPRVGTRNDWIRWATDEKAPLPVDARWDPSLPHSVSFATNKDELDRLLVGGELSAAHEAELQRLLTETALRMSTPPLGAATAP
ncbi:hypothetical protein [Roseomonas chloroacetimidivorans]|uniref:hypothetical protein n=1 Tax=Roseomonas chloroacetimidivorans TaxID=1766656 RepID=UPI003C74784C